MLDGIRSVRDLDVDGVEDGPRRRDGLDVEARLLRPSRSAQQTDGEKGQEKRNRPDAEGSVHISDCRCLIKLSTDIERTY